MILIGGASFFSGLRSFSMKEKFYMPVWKKYVLNAVTH